MGKNVVFIAAGGRGTRLWEDYPELKRSGLPKSLGIVVKNRPLIAYQLDFLVRLPDAIIVLTFNDQRSIRVFKNFIKTNKVPRYDYLYNMAPYNSSNAATIDVLKTSGPHKPWQEEFGFIIITSGDVYFDSRHLPNIVNTWKKFKCSVMTLSDFDKYMVSLKRHFHPVYSKGGWLKGILKSVKIPKVILSHPQFLTESAFRIYSSVPWGTSKSEFVIEAIRKGEKFKVRKPKMYININYLQDFTKLFSY